MTAFARFWQDPLYFKHFMHTLTQISEYHYLNCSVNKLLSQNIVLIQGEERQTAEYDCVLSCCKLIDLVFWSANFSSITNDTCSCSGSRWNVCSPRGAKA